MKIQDLVPEIGPYMQEMEKQLAGIAQAKVPDVDEVIRYIVQASGKRIRPALFFLVTGKDKNKLREVVPVAAAIELLHAATLVHDDVVDGSGLRRGVPTVNARWGTPVSILAGDYLFARAFVLLTKYGSHDIIKVFARVIEEMSTGEIEQLADLYNADLAEDVYLQRCAKKTAAFMSGVCIAGGIVRQAGEAEQSALHDYGLNLGIAFQIKDDLLDYNGKNVLLGKPAGNDLRQGGVTLPLIHLLTNSPRRDYFREKIKSREINDELIAEVTAAMRESRSLEYSFERVREFTARAVAALEAIPDRSLQKALYTLAAAADNRKC